MREAHETRKMAHGHDFDHALAVANLAGKFCEGPELVNLAWLAGLCHNADRIIAIDRGMGRREVPDEAVEQLVRGWLEDALIGWRKSAAIHAVLDHGKPNDPNDTAVTIALKDADRVVNARLDVVIRSGQFHADLPVLEPTLLINDTRGKYNARLTVVADLLDCLDWGNLNDQRFGVRTSGARAMITARVKRLREFLEAIVEQREEEGLVPYPIA